MPPNPSFLAPHLPSQTKGNFTRRFQLYVSRQDFQPKLHARVTRIETRGVTSTQSERTSVYEDHNDQNVVVM